MFGVTRIMLLFLGCLAAAVCRAITDDDAKTEYRKTYVSQYATEHYSATKDQWLLDFQVVFFDFDGDGFDEALIADAGSRDRSGNGWAVTRRNRTTGKIESHPLPKENGLSIWSYPDALFVLTIDNGKDCLCGQHVILYDIKRDGTINGRQRIYQDDAMFGMDSNGILLAKSLESGFAGLLAKPDFRRLDRVVTEFYKGCDAKLVSRGASAACVSPKRPNGALDFMDQYRRNVKKRMGITRKVTVYAVFVDVNGDDVADVYVSSDAETDADVGTRYRWHLFLNSVVGYIKASGTMWFNADKDYNRESVEPDETAAMDSFYSVQRAYGFKPSVVILDRDGDALHSRAFVRQIKSSPPAPPSKRLSYEQERTYSRALDEWEGEQKAKLGFLPAYDFSRLVSRPEFLRLERLQCVSFPEK